MSAMADNPTIQDVLRQFYTEYLEVYTPNVRQAKAADHILNCKTGAYGVNVSRCGQCGHIQIHNNSCRDRSCPMCQALSNELWVDAQNENVLDIDYYHMVFTCPSELNALIYCNQKELYSLFFNAGVICRSGNCDALPWTLHTSDSNRQQPHPPLRFLNSL